MLLLILLAASLMPTQKVSVNCANTAAIQTQPVPGPGGVVAVLRASSEDDRSKNSHLCNAKYQLLISGPGGSQRVADLLTSDDDYGRTLSLRLSGFSQDGKRILGIVSEGGKHPFTTLFDYHTSDGKAQLTDITEQFAPVMAANCSSMFEVIGTTKTGAIVLEMNSAARCASNRRWLLDSSRNRPRRLSQGTKILSLYQGKVDTR
jgi:hypothetical protein